MKEDSARTCFSNWIKGLWFAPNALKKAYRAANGLTGIYLPYWTYDTDTETSYVGQRGDHYYVTESYTDNAETKSRQVQKTRWTEVSGKVRINFDDFVVPATTSLPEDHLVGLEPWRLADLQPYSESFLAGFTVEAYQIGVEPGFNIACQRMSGPIRDAIERDIGGDLQKVISMSPRYYDITFKHILLPIWLSSYQYSGKTWRFIVNGQTGNVQGERPWSGWKIALAVAAIFAVLALVYLWISIP